MKILAYPKNSDFPVMAILLASSVHPNGRTGTGTIIYNGMEHEAIKISIGQETRWVFW